MSKEFSPGQKVVFSLKRLRFTREEYQNHQPWAVFPQEGEVVTVVRRSTNPGFWIIREYLVNRNGTLQGLSDLVLFPVEEVHARFTDQILSGIEKSIHPIKTPAVI